MDDPSPAAPPVESHPTHVDGASTEHDSTRLAGLILEQVDRVVSSAIEHDRPLEVDPAREQLFQLFVAADAADLTDEDRGDELSASEIVRRLGQTWGLNQAAQSQADGGAGLTEEQHAKMARLWSLLRLWNEWTYAWSRWDEFHDRGRTSLPPNA